jgi:hypothetical protein
MDNAMIIWIIIFAVFVIAFIFYLSLYGKVKRERQKADACLEQFKIENAVKITDHSRQGNIITGHAQNISKWVIEELHIDINYYDDNGYLIGNAAVKANNLNPGETWEFKQLIEDNSVSNYSLTINLPGMCI